MTFLPQFEACIKAGTYSVMCSYSRYCLLLCLLFVKFDLLYCMQCHAGYCVVEV